MFKKLNFGINLKKIYTVSFLMIKLVTIPMYHFTLSLDNKTLFSLKCVNHEAFF